MTRPEQGDDAGEASPRLYVRRVPDVQTLLGKRACNEVGWIVPGSSTPVRIERTRKPAGVLHAAGEHTTDIGDYVANADAAWAGGVGPWRGLHPYGQP